jgi:hypothetical protein
MSILKKFNRITEDEFALIKGTQLAADMIANKWWTDSMDVLDIIEQTTSGSYCTIKHLNGWLIYLQYGDDIMYAKQHLELAKNTTAPEIRSINILDDFQNT